MLSLFEGQRTPTLLTLLLGMLLIYLGYRKWKRTELGVPKRINKLQIGGMILCLLGIVRFSEDSLANIKWTLETTADKVATIEFPGTSTAVSETQDNQGKPITTTGWDCNLERRGMFTLRTFAVQDSELLLPAKARFENYKNATKTASSDTKIVAEGKGKWGEVEGFYLDVEIAQGPAILCIRNAFVGSMVYRATCFCTPAQRNGQLVTRFLDSFKVKASR